MIKCHWKCRRMSSNVIICNKMSENVTENVTEMWSNVRLKMWSNVTENVGECHRMSSNVKKCRKMWLKCVKKVSWHTLYPLDSSANTFIFFHIHRFYNSAYIVNMTIYIKFSTYPSKLKPRIYVQFSPKIPLSIRIQHSFLPFHSF